MYYSNYYMVRVSIIKNLIFEVNYSLLNINFTRSATYILYTINKMKVICKYLQNKYVFLIIGIY